MKESTPSKLTASARAKLSLGGYVAVLAVLMLARFFFGSLFSAHFTPFVLIAVVYAGFHFRLEQPDTIRAPLGYRRQLLSLMDGCIACVGVLPLYLFTQYWLSRLTGSVGFAFQVPDGFFMLILVQVIAVAVPEELFFRSLLQPGLRGPFHRRLRVGQGDIGGEVVLTSILFAFAHVLMNGISLMALLVFFPSLLFGLLYARRGSVAGAVVFHAACNLTLALFPLQP